MNLIPLWRRGKIAAYSKVDDDDFESLSKYKWYLWEPRHTHYRSAYRFIKVLKTTKKMHRQVMAFGSRLPFVDHIDGDTLNNQKSNLRICNDQENHRNRFKNQKRCISKYKGVCTLTWKNKHGDMKKWRAYIVVNNRQISLGVFSSEPEAAKAYDNGAIELFGDFARLNFPASGKKSAVIHH